jgi:phosphatidylinositol glycan class C protein
VSQEVSTVTLFILTFHYLYENAIQPQKVLFNSFVLTGVGYVIFALTDFSKIRNVIEDSKTVGVVLLFGYIFSPLLHTLTDSISTDTIFSSTFIILFFHLLLHDYGIDGFLVSRTVSLNAGIFASICLASRLHSSFSAFVLLVVSAEIFVLKPLLFKKIWRPWMILPIVGVTSYALFNVSRLMLIVYLTILTFVNIICPFVFHNLHNHKNIVQGPWDEASLDASAPKNKNKKESL